MKRILSLFTMALVCAATPVFAAFDFEVVWQQYENANYEGTDGRYFTIKVTGGTGKIYLTDMFNTIQSGDQNEALTAPEMGVTKFGYSYVKGGDGLLHEFELTPDSDRVVQLDSNLNSYSYYDINGIKQTRSRNGYYLGEFNDGDEIQVFMSATTTDADGNEVSQSASSNTPTGDYISKTAARVDKLDGTLQIASLYLPHQVNFGILGGGGEHGSSSAVTVGNGETVGQPLPGGLSIALIAGLFALGFWYVRRRKAVSA